MRVKEESERDDLKLNIKQLYEKYLKKKIMASSPVTSSQTDGEIIETVQFSRSVMSDSLRPHESQHARPPWPSPSPGVHSDSRPSSPWCHPAISSSVVPFSSCPQSLPTSKSFPMSQLFAWGDQSTGACRIPLYPHCFGLSGRTPGPSPGLET